MNADLPCGGGRGFRKGQRAEGVERRGQKVAGWGPVYVCLQTIYVLNSGVFLSTPPTYALSLPGRGLALRPERVYTLIDLIFAHCSALQDMCICMLSVDDPSLKNGPFCPRGDTNWDKKAR